jgi:CDGSH-type Zn-finger protein
MANATIIIRDNASARVIGPARVVDIEGNLVRELAEGEVAGLCRCGQSRDKPWCDSTHKEIGWSSVVRAATAPVEETVDPD